MSRTAYSRRQSQAAAIAGISSLAVSVSYQLHIIDCPVEIQKNYAAHHACALCSDRESFSQKNVALCYFIICIWMRKRSGIRYILNDNFKLVITNATASVMSQNTTFLKKIFIGILPLFLRSAKDAAPWLRSTV